MPNMFGTDNKRKAHRAKNGPATHKIRGTGSNTGGKNTLMKSVSDRHADLTSKIKSTGQR